MGPAGAPGGQLVVVAVRSWSSGMSLPTHTPCVPAPSPCCCRKAGPIVLPEAAPGAAATSFYKPPNTAGSIQPSQATNHPTTKASRHPRLPAERGGEGIAVNTGKARARGRHAPRARLAAEGSWEVMAGCVAKGMVTHACGHWRIKAGVEHAYMDRSQVPDAPALGYAVPGLKSPSANVDKIPYLDSPSQKGSLPALCAACVTAPHMTAPACRRSPARCGCGG